METRLAVCTLSICLFGLSGIIIASIGSEMLPTSLTQEEMRRTPTGAPCTPEVCSQMITEKQRSSEGFKMILIGVSFLGFVLLVTCGGIASITLCPRRINRVMALEVEEQQHV
jgi:hypothetical protein